MKPLFKSAAVALMSLALIFGLTSPASAGTKSGTHSCASIARNAVRGEQQRFSMMTLKISNSVVYKKYGDYVGWGYSPSGGTTTWSAHSDWLLWSGTYATCAPKIIH